MFRGFSQLTPRLPIHSSTRLPSFSVPGITNQPSALSWNTEKTYSSVLVKAQEVADKVGLRRKNLTYV